MIKIHFFKALFLALFLCCFFPAPAQALQVNVNNNTGVIVRLVFIYYDIELDEWVKRGWIPVFAGQRTSFEFEAEIGTIYYYGSTRDGSREWTLPDGHPQASADDIIDDRMDVLAKRTLSGPGHRYVNFIKYDFDSDPITININD